MSTLRDVAEVGTSGASLTISKGSVQVVIDAGGVGIGGARQNPQALDVRTTEAMRLPAGTSAQRPAGAPAGTLRFNTDLAAFEYRDGSTWVQIGSAAQSSRGWRLIYGPTTLPAAQTYTWTGWSSYREILWVTSVGDMPGATYNDWSFLLAGGSEHTGNYFVTMRGWKADANTMYTHGAGLTRARIPSGALWGDIVTTNAAYALRIWNAPITRSGTRPVATGWMIGRDNNANQRMICWGFVFASTSLTQIVDGMRWDTSTASGFTGGVAVYVRTV